MDPAPLRHPEIVIVIKEASALLRSQLISRLQGRGGGGGRGENLGGLERVRVGQRGVWWGRKGWGGGERGEVERGGVG